MKLPAYFKEEVILMPSGGRMPRWLWDFTNFGLWFAVIGMALAAVGVFINP